MKPIDASIRASGTSGLPWLAGGNWARRALFSRFRTLREGWISIQDGDLREPFGATDAELRAQVIVHDPRFYHALATRGTIGAGESFARGWWSCDDLPTLVRILVLNRDLTRTLDGGLAKLTAPLRRLLHLARRNTRRGSRRNIAAHYDLGNDFYELMLDPTMTYSCGIFEHPKSTMEEASIEKMDRLCRKLQLEPTDHLLEIGTGWGGLALHATQRYGCRVTTTTLSAEQAQFARQRVREAGLEDRIEVIETDYRDLEGRFDKLVSVEMIEAIGLAQLPGYFERCSSLLADDGLMALQSIIIEDRFFEEASRSVDFIQHYIFPGGALPSVGALAEAAKKTDLRIAHLEDITVHYARTLQEWRRRLDSHAVEVRELGYSEDFLRLWEFYLGYCEGGFLAGSIGDVQMVLAKPRAPREALTVERRC